MTRFEKMEGYPDEIQGRFNSFITTQFDDSLSVEMQIRSLIKWISSSRDLINDIVDYINLFIEMFDERLQEEIVLHLNKWLDDGTLAQIINNDVFDMKADKVFVDSEIERLDQKDEDLNTQLEQKAYKTSTVDEMKTMDLNVGDYVYTTGYYQSSDKGNAHYVIVPSGTHSGNVGFYQTLDNGLQAELIYNDRVNIHQLGAKGDGVTDDSIPFTVAFRENVTIATENKTYRVKPSVIYIKNNMTWISNNTQIKLIHDESISGNQTIVSADGVDNWNIRGRLELVGDLDDWYANNSHLTNGEQQAIQNRGLGFALRDSDNFYIEHLVIRDCNSFGFYNSLISMNNEDDSCKNGRIDTLEAYNNRESNLVLSAIDKVTFGRIISKRSGKTGLATHYPRCGVVCEMDFNVCRLWNLRIDELYTADNVGESFHYYGANLQNTPLEKRIEISIGLHVDDSSKHNFSVSGDGLETTSFSGYITVEKSIYKQRKNNSSISFVEWGEWLPHITFNDPSIEWLGTDTASDLSFVDASQMGNAGHGTGNFTFNRPHFKCGKQKIKNGFNLSTGGWAMANINIIDPVTLDCQAFIKTHVATRYDNTHISDNNVVMVSHIPVSVNVNAHYSTITNRDSTFHQVSYVNLPNNFECEFVVVAPYTFSVQTSTHTFKPDQQTGTYKLTSNEVGSRLRLKKINGETYILNKVGNWKITESV